MRCRRDSARDFGASGRFSIINNILTSKALDWQGWTGEFVANSMQGVQRGIVRFAKDLWDYCRFCASIVEMRSVMAMIKDSSAGAWVGEGYVINNNTMAREFRRSKPLIVRGPCIVAVWRGFDRDFRLRRRGYDTAGAQTAPLRRRCRIDTAGVQTKPLRRRCRYDVPGVGTTPLRKHWGNGTEVGIGRRIRCGAELDQIGQINPLNCKNILDNSGTSDTLVAGWLNVLMYPPYIILKHLKHFSSSLTLR